MPFDAATGEARVSLPTGFLVHVLFSPDGARVLTVSHERRKLSLWDAPSGKEVLGIPVPAGVAGPPSFSPNGRWVLCACHDKAARIWSADTGEELSCFRGHQSGVGSAAFSPDGARVVTASTDGTVRIWNPQPGRDYARVLPGSQGMSQVDFSPDGRRLATGGRHAGLWDIEAGKLLHTLRGLASLADSLMREEILGTVLSLEFSADGRRLLVATKEGPAKILKRTLFGFGRDAEEQVPFTPVRLWDVEAGKEMLGFRGARAEVGRAAFSPNGKLILAAETGRQDMRTFSHTGIQRGISGGTIPDGQAYIWDAVTGQLVQTLKDHKDGITYSSWSPDGKRVLTADRSNGFWADGGAARLWDVETGKPIVTLEGDQGGVRLATFRPDGKHVLMLQSGWRPGVEIWDTTTGHVALILGPSQPGGLSQKWDANEKKWVPRRRGLMHGGSVGSETVPVHASNVTYAAYSPDGRLIVTTSWDKTARIWDAATGKHRPVLRGHILALRHAAFSADSKRVVTASDDDTARVWDAKTGEETITLAGHRGPVLSATFSPDGRFVATASTDGTARIWPVDPVPLAISRKPRDLGTEERERFGVGGPTKP
jgi:WD40 repeat protein